MKLQINHSGTAQNEANKPKNRIRIPSEDKTNDEKPKDDNEKKPNDDINPNTCKVPRNAVVKYRRFLQDNLDDL